MNRPHRILRLGSYLLLASMTLALVCGTGIWLYLEPKLPSIEILKDVRLQVPLRVYTRDRLLLAEFGEKKRAPLRMDQVPKAMVQAVLAAEDDRFYEHPGVDWQGLARAAWHLLRTGEKGQGGSTITMQVARNFFLGREKTYLRKLNEIILSFKIERSLSKDEILNLYLNKIYLGQRSYGVGAAAKVYYGRPIGELNLAQLTMIAGLPKAPSRYNPIADPDRAVTRRNYVLRRMRELGYITPEVYDTHASAPVTARLHKPAVAVEAPYIAEMVRSYMVEQYGEEAYTDGYSVYTTVDSRLQEAAGWAVRKALREYSERHGYRGPEGHVGLLDSDGPERWAEALKGIRAVAGFEPAVVTSVGEQSVSAYQRGMDDIEIPWKGLEWARPYIDENRRGPKPETAADILTPGDIVRVRLDDLENWRLTQLPKAEGALVSLNPQDGAIIALRGGFDFYRSKFNRITQAKRQPGSNFKPFIYSAALEHGYTTASLINDAPVVFDDPSLEGAWRPENYSGKFFGPTRLRLALIKSRNLVSIRLLRALGVDKALEHVEQFGFNPVDLPHNLSLALGSGVLPPLKVAAGYTVFANGGYRVEPYFIERITGNSDETLFEASPRTVCPACKQIKAGHSSPSEGEERIAQQEQPGLLGTEPPQLSGNPAPRAISSNNCWLMTSILRDVVRRGTGRRAYREMKRNDLAGKTGTTNDQRDAWFSGFNHHLTTTAWVGFDDLTPLGARETGGRAALPMWVAFMSKALKGIEERPLELPEGLVTVRIDPATGKRVGASFPKAIFETFRVENAPPEQPLSRRGGVTPKQGSRPPETVTEQLF